VPTALLAQEAKRSKERRETESIGLSKTGRRRRLGKGRRSRREQNRVYKALKHKGKGTRPGPDRKTPACFMQSQRRRQTLQTLEVKGIESSTVNYYTVMEY
jgi:hypothetical protein